MQLGDVDESWQCVNCVMSMHIRQDSSRGVSIWIVTQLVHRGQYDCQACGYESTARVLMGDPCA